MYIALASSEETYLEGMDVRNANLHGDLSYDYGKTDRI